MSWHARIAQGNPENVRGIQAKKTVTASTLGLKRSALGEIGNKVVGRSNTTVGTKPGLIASVKEINKPLQRSSSVRSIAISNTQKTDFVPPLPKLKNVTSRVKRTFSNTSVASVVLPSRAERVEKDQETNVVAESKIENVDKADENNPMLVGYYVFEIYQYLQSLEDKFPIQEDFLKGQQVTSRMRAVLVDWLVDVQSQYRLLQETLYLAVQIIDRYLQAVPTIGKKYLQLVGVAAIYIASKYEEVYMPDINDFVFITDGAYTKKELLEMEAQVVKKLEFQFSRPISLTFLRRYSKVVEANPLHHCFSKYYLELALMEYSLCHVKPSLIAAAALFISMCIHELRDKKGPQHWNAKMVHYSSYTLEEVLTASQKLAAVIEKANTSKLQAVKKKYSNAKMMKVSMRCENDSEPMKRLAKGLTPFP